MDHIDMGQHDQTDMAQTHRRGAMAPTYLMILDWEQDKAMLILREDGLIDFLRLLDGLCGLGGGLGRSLDALKGSIQILLCRGNVVKGEGRHL
jgi:hypothetical protein